MTQDAAHNTTLDGARHMLLDAERWTPDRARDSCSTLEKLCMQFDINYTYSKPIICKCLLIIPILRTYIELHTKYT